MIHVTTAQLETHWGAPSADWGLANKRRLLPCSKLTFRPVDGGRFELLRKIEGRTVRALRGETHPLDDIPPLEGLAAPTGGIGLVCAWIFARLDAEGGQIQRIERVIALARLLHNHRRGYVVAGLTIIGIARTLKCSQKTAVRSINALIGLRVVWVVQARTGHARRYELSWAAE